MRVPRLVLALGGELLGADVNDVGNHHLTRYLNWPKLLALGSRMSFGRLMRYISLDSHCCYNNEIGRYSRLRLISLDGTEVGKTIKTFVVIITSFFSVKICSFFHYCQTNQNFRERLSATVRTPLSNPLSPNHGHSSLAKTSSLQMHVPGSDAALPQDSQLL